MNPPKYEVIECDNGFHKEHWCIRILEGDYTGLVYQYDVVKFNENEESGDTELSFNTITVNNPNDVDLTKENEKGILGAILVDILQEQMEQMRENGTPDSEQPTT